MREVRIARYAEVTFPVDREAVRERFGARFRRAGDYTEAALLGAAAVLPADPPAGLGVFLGSGLANLAAIVPMIGSIHHPTAPRCSPLAFASSVANAAAFALAQAFDLGGHNVTVSQEELSFEAALLEAWLCLQDGTCTWALVGALDVAYPDADAQRVRIGAVGVPGELGSGAGFVLLGPEGPWRLDAVRVGAFDPLADLVPGTTIVRGWTCQDLDARGAPPAGRDLFGAASAVGVVRALQGEGNRFVHVQRHRDGAWGRVEASR